MAFSHFDDEELEEDDFLDEGLDDELDDELSEAGNSSALTKGRPAGWNKVLRELHYLKYEVKAKAKEFARFHFL